MRTLMQAYHRALLNEMVCFLVHPGDSEIYCLRNGAEEGYYLDFKSNQFSCIEAKKIDGLGHSVVFYDLTALSNQTRQCMIDLMEHIFESKEAGPLWLFIEESIEGMSKWWHLFSIQRFLRMRLESIQKQYPLHALKDEDNKAIEWTRLRAENHALKQKRDALLAKNRRLKGKLSKRRILSGGADSEAMLKDKNQQLHRVKEELLAEIQKLNVSLEEEMIKNQRLKGKLSAFRQSNQSQSGISGKQERSKVSTSTSTSRTEQSNKNSLFDGIFSRRKDTPKAVEMKESVANKSESP